MKSRHSLATLIFSEVAPHFPNEILEKTNLNLTTGVKDRESEDCMINSSTHLFGEQHCGSDWRRTGM